MAFMRTFAVLVLLAVVAGAALVAPPILYGQTQQPGPLPFPLVTARSTIGAAVRDAEPQEGASADAAPGVVIDDVEPAGPADQAGLKKGDRVTVYDGERVRSVRQFSRLVSETPAGRSVEATIVRDGRTMTLRLTPRAERRAEVLLDGERLRARLDELNRRFRSFAFDDGRVRPRLGVTVQELTPQLAAFFGAKAGVLVSGVTDGSPAAKAGLLAGDVITRVNDAAIASRADLIRALGGIASGASVRLEIVRDKRERSVELKVSGP